MIEFNPDGSMKIPAHIENQKKQDENRLRSQRCIKIKKEVINFDSPKKCKLRITLSDVITDNRFVQNIYDNFEENSSVPTKLNKINEKQFEVEIATDFKRCTDCNSLINRYREFLDGNIVEDKGNCTFEGRNFSYEDYFD